jgi:prolyl 4-hydroxylase
MEPQPSSSDAEAAHVQAMYAAEGTGVPSDWNAALDHLQHAAELGHALAQAELAALSGDWALSGEIGAGKVLPLSAWENLRRSADPTRWLTPPRPRIVSASPRIATVEGMASPEMCDWLMTRARSKLAPAEVYDHETGGQRIENVRTNSACYFRWEDSDLLLLALRARMASVAELPVYGLESTAVLHYTVGQEFHPHFDFLDIAKPGHAKDVAGRGQRVLTFLMALNDDYEGGETEFPALGKRWKGRKGSTLFFWNVEPDGTIDRRTLHAGLPPTRGEKWLLSQWMRARPAEGDYSPNSVNPG